MILQALGSLLLRLLFYKAPEFRFSEEEKQEYESMYKEAIACGGTIQYKSKFPKHRFIQYIIDYKNLLVHGSNTHTIEQFTPKQQTLYNGKLVEAVFASDDGIWSVFYAVFDRSKLVNNFRNGSISAGASKSRYHYYSFDQLTSKKSPWINGTLYFLPGESFISAAKIINPESKGIIFHEWISDAPVQPIAKLEVKPEDFYFLDKVASHKDRESVLRTWLFYKWRRKIKHVR